MAEYYYNFYNIAWKWKSKRSRGMIRVKKLELTIKAHFDEYKILDDFTLIHKYERIILPKELDGVEAHAYKHFFRNMILNVREFQILRILVERYFISGPYVIRHLKYRKNYNMSRLLVFSFWFFP